MCRIKSFFKRLIIAILVISVYGEAHAGGKTSPDHDPLRVLSRLLRAVYPDLAGQQGLATIKVGFVNDMFDPRIHLEFHPCILYSSGVTEQKSSGLHCGEPLGSNEPFLELSVAFGSSSRQPIWNDFNAYGSFVDGKLNTIRERFGNRVHSEIDMHDKKRYWTDADLINAIEAGHPKYGPDQKPAFSMSLPIKGFEALTECELNPETLQFITTQPGVSSPVGEWQIKGKVRSSTSTSVANCDAEFEPFEGHLTSFHEF